MRIYIATALTHVPRERFAEYATFVHSLAGALQAPPHYHDVKYALVNSDPQLAEKPLSERAKLCYHWDRDMVERADVVVAEASFPSIGLGIEMQIAESKSIPIVLCFRDFGQRASKVKYENPDHSTHELQIGEGFVTLMALGNPAVFRVLQYDEQDDGLKKILNVVDLLDRRLSQ
jgi:hypothetical protein